jgi:hypothetical protein
VVTYRLYIDESGDHGYKHADEISNRYLGLSGLLVEKNCYGFYLQPSFEQLKRLYFKYDVDDPPILVCNRIKEKRGCFWVLRDDEIKHKWRESIISYFSSLVCHCQLFTVVIDKLEHKERYTENAFDPYTYAFKVLLNRVMYYLHSNNLQADVIPESRGKNEDHLLREAYTDLRENGDRWSPCEKYFNSYPENELFIKRKDQNIAGLQIVDLVAYGQKLETISKADAPLPVEITPFTQRVNDAIRPMVNKYGQYFLV